MKRSWTKSATETWTPPERQSSSCTAAPSPLPRSQVLTMTCPEPVLLFAIGLPVLDEE